MSTIGAATLAMSPSLTLSHFLNPRLRISTTQANVAPWGIYYTAPILGPAIEPLIGGVVAQLISWHATLYFLVIFAWLSLVSFVIFTDTFQRQRSLSYQSALRIATREREDKLRANQGQGSLA